MEGSAVLVTPRSAAPRSSSKDRPDPLIIQPTTAHTHTFILLHGLGSNGEKLGREFVDSATSSDDIRMTELFSGMKFVFPTAKKRRSIAFKRAMINQWFDILSLEDPSKRQDLQLEGLAESAAYILSVLGQEMDTIRPENIILGGLSQGCAMALFVLLSLDFPLGGFVGMSGWLPFRKDIDEVVCSVDSGGGEDIGGFSFDREEEDIEEIVSVQAVNLVRNILSMDQIAVERSNARPPCLRTPVFLGHGDNDEKVNCKLGKEAARTLLALEMDVTWKSYCDFGHWYKVPDEIDDILAFLHSKL